MDDLKNSYFEIEKKEKSSLPISQQVLNFLSDDEMIRPFERLKGLKEEEDTVFARLSEEVENIMDYANDMISYTSVWHGRVLSVFHDVIKAQISNRQEDDAEYHVEIMKNMISSDKSSQMVPGTMFDWSFGYKNMDPKQRFWKIEIKQQLKPSPESIKQMASKMIAGFESYYADKDF